MEQHDLSYSLAYWITALLPIILGFGLTILILVILQRKYKGSEDDEEK